MCVCGSFILLFIGSLLVFLEYYLKVSFKTNNSKNELFKNGIEKSCINVRMQCHIWPHMVANTHTHTYIYSWTDSLSFNRAALKVNRLSHCMDKPSFRVMHYSSSFLFHSIQKRVPNNRDSKQTMVEKFLFKYPRRKESISSTILLIQFSELIMPSTYNKLNSLLNELMNSLYRRIYCARARV